MRKKKAVEWKKVSAAERVFSLPEALLRCVLGVAAMNLNVFAALFMMNGIWPGIVLGGKGFLWVFSEILFCALGFELLLPFLNGLQKGDHPVLRRVVVSGAALLGCGWIAFTYLRDHMEQLILGWQTIVGKYMAVYNLHFHTEIRMPAGDPEQVPLVLTAVVCLMIFLLWVLAFLLGNKYIWAIMPLGIWAVSMFVGVPPEWKGIVWFWVDLFLIDNISEMVGLVGKLQQNSRGRREYAKSKGLRSLLTLGLLLLVFLSVSALGKTPSERAIDRAPRFRAYEKELEQKLSSFSIKGIDPETLLGRRKLRSKQNDYAGKTILSLQTSEKPVSNIYLKNYQSGTYTNGGWVTEGNAFETACEKDGMDSKALQQLLLGWAYEKQYGSVRGDYGITYRKWLGTDALYPYYIASEDLNGEKLSQDVLIGKSLLRRKNTLQGALDTVPENIYLDKYYQAEEEEEKLWDWYSTYVQQHYTMPSESVPFARTLAERIYTGTITGPEWSVNEQRLQMAGLVSAVLSSYRYSLDMGQVPGDKDLVEYFLSEGGKGFCVHFATAGVQICRNLGIPARYCEGYIAKQSAFEKKDGGYTCDVEDRTAHAWVEIYLEHIGWVPIEMTPGYGSEQISEITQNLGPLTALQPDAEEKQQSESAEENVEESTAESSEESSEESTENTLGETEDVIVPAETQPDADEDVYRKVQENLAFETEEDGENSRHAHVGIIIGEQNLKQSILKGLLSLMGTMAAVVLTVLLARGIYLRKKREYEAKIPRAIRRGRYKAAVLMMNRRLYKRLKKEGGLSGTQPTDREYGQALQKRYCAYKGEQWNTYMDTVKQAAFSEESLTEEQALMCYALYREICAADQETDAK